MRLVEIGTMVSQKVWLGRGLHLSLWTTTYLQTEAAMPVSRNMLFRPLNLLHRSGSEDKKHEQCR